METNGGGASFWAARRYFDDAEAGARSMRKECFSVPPPAAFYIPTRLPCKTIIALALLFSISGAHTSFEKKKKKNTRQQSCSIRRSRHRGANLRAPLGKSQLIRRFISLPELLTLLTRGCAFRLDEEVSWECLLRKRN